jgi:hypothetical protein
MTPVRGFPAGWALGLLLLAPQLAPAAWDNVFQVTCCHKRPTVAAFAPVTACAPPCPAPCPSVAYVQRSFYTPVTSFVAETRYEPVTSFRTSFFWEPVTSFTFSSYFDPCTCSCKQVACPTTSYRLRSQCNAVTNYVARVCYRPVTTFRQSCYLEAVPVNPCCPGAAPAVGAGVAEVPPAAALPSTPAPPLNLPSTPGAGLNEQRTLPPSGGAGVREEYSIPPATQSYRPGQAPAPPAAPARPFRPERVAALPAGTTVTGRVVRNDFAPRPGAKLVFVSASRQDVRQAATADTAGRFQVSLAAGRWYVYVDDATGKLTYHNQFDVRGEPRPVTVVSR